MSSDKRNISVNDYEINIDLYSILRDIWKYAIVILLLAASMSLLSYVYVGRNYHKQYESTSTFIVSSKGSNNSVYSDLSATSEMATKFSEILNSSILQKKVAKEMDMDYFPGSAVHHRKIMVSLACLCLVLLVPMLARSSVSGSSSVAEASR